MDEDTRNYYKKIWDFDPIADRVALQDDADAPPNSSYYYQAVIPLERDPELVERGVKMYARVYVDNKGNVHNRIVFEGKTRTSLVECAHTIVYRAPVEELKTLTEEDFIALVNRHDGSLAELPPWEHFASLKSFAAGIAAIGLHHIEELNLNHREPLPFIVDSNLLNQIVRALIEIAPDLFKSSQRSQFDDIIHQAPVKWIADRWEILQQKYDATGLIIDEEFLQSLKVPTRQKLVELYCLLMEIGEELNAGWKEELVKFKREFFNILLSDDFLEKTDPTLLHKILEEMILLENFIEIARIFIHLFAIEDKQFGDTEFLREIFLKMNTPKGISVISKVRSRIEEIVRTTSARSLR